MRRLLPLDPRIGLLSDQLARHCRNSSESGVALARRVGVHPSQVSRLLRKKHKTLNRSVRQICEVVGLKIPGESFSQRQETNATLNEAIGKITGDDAGKREKLTQLLQIIASLTEKP
jgi:transcriptional regulator with XRE-family HTH domain